MLKRALPKIVFKKGNFFNTIFTLNSAANIAIPKHLNYHIVYVMNTGEKMRKNLSYVIASMTTNIKERTDKTITKSLYVKKALRNTDVDISENFHEFFSSHFVD